MKTLDHDDTVAFCCHDMRLWGKFCAVGFLFPLLLRMNSCTKTWIRMDKVKKLHRGRQAP